MGFSTNWAQGGRGSSLVEQKGNSFVLFSSKIAASPTVGKGKRDFRLRLKLTAKQRKIGRNRPQIPVQSWQLMVVARRVMKKIIAMMITSDFDGWGGSHAGSVNTGMEIEEKLSGGLKPSALLSSGPLFRSCTALATTISQSSVALLQKAK